MYTVPVRKEGCQGSNRVTTYTSPYFHGTGILRMLSNLIFFTFHPYLCARLHAWWLGFSVDKDVAQPFELLPFDEMVDIPQYSQSSL